MTDAPLSSESAAREIAGERSPMGLLGCPSALVARLGGSIAEHGVELDKVGEVEGCDMVIIGPEMTDPVGCAQQAYWVNRGVRVLILTAPDQFAEVKRDLMTAPFVPRTTRCLKIDDPQLTESVDTEYGSVSVRRRYAARVEEAQSVLEEARPVEGSSAHYLLSELLTILPVGVAVLDEAGWIISWNATATRLLGLGEREVISRPFLDLMPTRHRPALGSDGSRVEMTKWGRSLEFTRTPMSAASGHRGSLVLIQDVTARRKLEQAERLKEVAEAEARLKSQHLQAIRDAERKLAAYSAALERSNRDVEQFAFLASHDMQEPLRKIRTLGSLLNERFGEELGKDGRDWVVRMASSAEKLSELVTGLLAFSRVANRRAPMARVSLTSLMTRVEADLESAIKESGGRIAVAGQFPEVYGDEVLLRQLLVQIVGNGLKFRHPDRPPLVQVSGSQLQGGEGDDWCEIRIADNGIGFHEGYAERLFLPFRKYHPPGEFSGTGIGLAICRRIVDHHQGVITADSVADEGSTFVIRLPAREAGGSDRPTGA